MSDEAVRKEFEAWALRNLPKVIGPVDWPMWFECWQAARSAAIQECADKLKIFKEATVPNFNASIVKYTLQLSIDSLLALEERW